MATVSRNTDVKETFDASLAGIPIVPGQAINQGDFVMWDATLNAGNGGLRTPVTQGDMATYMGIAKQQSPIASLGDLINTMGIRLVGIVRAHTTPGETYTMFQKVFFNETIDVQTITNNTNSGARTVQVGFIILPQQLTMGGSTSLLGAAGIDIQVWISPAYPVVQL
jgi:hypothetical protein